MKKFAKVLLITVCLLVVFAVLGITVTIGWRPFVGPRSRSVTDVRYVATPEKLVRGEYLVRGVLGCLDCHSEHDWNTPGGQLVPGREGAGTVFPAEGLPGRIIAPNITPDRETGIGSWTDDEIGRAIREGVSQDGHALFPLMPYSNFRRLSDEDLAATVVFLRSLAPIRNSLPRTEIAFPVRYLIRTVPQPLTEPVPNPDLSTPEKRGEYLTTLASCAECHTPLVRGMPDSARPFAGGQVFKGPWGTATSANITPHTTGIAYYNEKLFIDALRTGNVMGRQLNPIMPWDGYRHMNDEDLKAVFAYLRTVRPIENRIRTGIQ